jgi:hypothetical protein
MLTLMAGSWKLTILPVIANALPEFPTTLATNKQEIVAHMWTYSDNSPQALSIKQKKHQRPTSCARTKLREKREHDDEKKDRTKKIHKSIIRILENAAAARALEVNLELAEVCQKFLNAHTKGSAEQDPSHQFNKLNLTEVCFAPGIVQRLYHGKFISTNLSTPSNFTAFAFYKQPPFLCVKQENYLFCHLIHKIGIKQLPEEIKSSLMQDVIVPNNYTLLGVQLQYIVGA